MTYNECPFDLACILKDQFLNMNQCKKHNTFSKHKFSKWYGISYNVS